MEKRIYLSSPHMSDEGYELAFVTEAFDTNWIAPVGPNVKGFEKELAEYVGIDYAVALISGTAAIHLSLKLAGVEKGDIVLCQSLTFSATANPIIYENGIPVFVDSEEKTWNMDPDALEEAFKKYPNAKAVLVVHLYGMSTDMDRIVEICERNNAVLIEDAAEALGSTYKGKSLGTFGDFGIYSFNGNKIITTAGGGMLVSNNKEAMEKAFFWATQSKDDAPYYQHTEIGYNYRISNVNSGIGRGQLKVLDQRVEKKRYIYEYYKKALADIKDIHFMPENEWDYPNRWLSAMTLTGEVTPTDVLSAFEKANIEGRRVWKPMHLQPIFEKYDYIGGDVSKRLFDSGVCLPSDTKMTDEDLDVVCETIKNLWS